MNGAARNLLEHLEEAGKADSCGLGVAQLDPLDGRNAGDRSEHCQSMVAMIGSPELDVDGITRDGEHVPVLRNGAWQV